MQAFFFLFDKTILLTDSRKIETARKTQMPIMRPNRRRPFGIFIENQDSKTGKEHKSSLVASRFFFLPSNAALRLSASLLNE
jgi:hypothetical protein